MTNPKLKRVRVSFQSRDEPSEDDTGTNPGEWKERFQDMCQVIWLRGSEPVIAQRLQGVNPVVLRLRSSESARSVDATWRAKLVLAGTFLAIRSIIPDVGDRNIEITCEAGTVSD